MVFRVWFLGGWGNGTALDYRSEAPSCLVLDTFLILHVAQDQEDRSVSVTNFAPSESAYNTELRTYDERA